MKLGIIVGATRQNRQTIKQATWVLKGAEQLKGVKAELIDLKDYPMPFFDEAISPRYNPEREIDPAVEPWLKKLESFDAYIFVTPEYNHSIPGVLKNALDYVTWEIQRKPVSIVSHGSAGGARAAIQLKVIISESKAVPLPTFTPLTMVHMSDRIDEEGNLDEAEKTQPYNAQEALGGMLAELQWYSDALGAARAKDK